MIYIQHKAAVARLNFR